MTKWAKERATCWCSAHCPSVQWLALGGLGLTETLDFFLWKELVSTKYSLEKQKSSVLCLKWPLGNAQIHNAQLLKLKSGSPTAMRGCGGAPVINRLIMKKKSSNIVLSMRLTPHPTPPAEHSKPTHTTCSSLLLSLNRPYAWAVPELCLCLSLPMCSFKVQHKSHLLQKPFLITIVLTAHCIPDTLGLWSPIPGRHPWDKHRFRQCLSPSTSSWCSQWNQKSISSGLSEWSGTEVNTELVKQAPKWCYDPAKVVKNSLFLEGLSRKGRESTGHRRWNTVSSRLDPAVREKTGLPCFTLSQAGPRGSPGLLLPAFIIQPSPATWLPANGGP